MIIKSPNLPKAKVRCVIVDANAPSQLFEYLKNNKIDYVKSTYIENVLDAVSTHPDMQICSIGDGIFVCEPTTYEYYKKQLEIFGVNVTKGEKYIGSNYPDDVAYNVVVTEKYLLHNISHSDKVITDIVNKLHRSIFATKQGYTMCATCIIDENVVITDDAGIYKACCNNGIDCLLVDKSNVLLGSRDDGFLGGCCGMIGYKKLLFCGDIKRHKNYRLIKEFADKYSVELVSAYDGPLVDIGSIIPVVQE